MKGVDELRAYLQSKKPAPVRQVIFVRLSDVEKAGENLSLVLALANSFAGFARARELKMFPVGDLDYFFFSTGSATRLYGSVSELRGAIEDGLSRYAPDLRSRIDMRMAIQAHDLLLTGQLPEAIVEGHLDRILKANPEPPKTRARLSTIHIEAFEAAWRKLGTSELAARIVCRQQAHLVRKGKPPEPVFTELYCSVDALKREVLGPVDLRGASKTFAMLTLTFDRVLLQAWPTLNPDNSLCSVNLNVETLFSPDFDSFLKRQSGGSLAHMIFEFRASDILEDLDRFQAAREMVTRRGAIVAIDGLSPSALEALNLDRLGIRVAKLFATLGEVPDASAFREKVSELQRRDIMVVLARTADKKAFNAGRDAGVLVFQGFHIDRMAAKKLEPEAMDDAEDDPPKRRRPSVPPSPTG